MRLGSRKLSISMLAVLFGSLALLLSACGTTTSTGPQDKAKDQILKMTWSGAGATDVPTLDPGLSSDAQSIPLIDLMFDGLVVLDQNLKVQLWGADKVDVSGDGLTYTFHVRANQKFSDGKAVKASDYAYGMNRTLNPCFASSVNYYLFDLKDASTFANEKCTNGTISAADGTDHSGHQHPHRFLDRRRRHGLDNQAHDRPRGRLLPLRPDLSVLVPHRAERCLGR